MSMDAVDGGKVWTPPKFDLSNKVRIDTILRVFSGLGGVAISMSIIIGIALWNSYNVKHSASMPYIATQIEGMADNSGAYSLLLFSSIVMIINPGVVVAFLLAAQLAYKTTVLKYLTAGFFVGIMFSLALVSIINSNEFDPKLAVNEWMQENYNYSLIEILPVNTDAEPHAMLDTGEEKFLVEDLATGEEKTVYLYERDDSFYLATDDTDFAKQMNTENSVGK